MYDALDALGRAVHDNHRELTSLRRQLDQATQENSELKQRVQELEDALLTCKRCGRGIGEE